MGSSPALLLIPKASATWKVSRLIKKQAWEKDEKRERFRVTTDSQQQMEGKFSLAGRGRTDFILECLLGEEGCAEFFVCIAFFKNFYLFIYLFMAVLGLRFCARTSSSCGKRGPLFIAVRGPLIIAASLVADHGLQTRRLSSCGSRA